MLELTHGRRGPARLLCLVFFLALTGLLWVLWNMMNAVVCLIHLVLFWMVCDLAFAAVSNSHGLLTFGLENSIAFLKSAVEGDHLVAEAVETLNHHKIPFCEIKVRNQRGELICNMTGLAFRKEKPMPSVE